MKLLSVAGCFLQEAGSFVGATHYGQKDNNNHMKTDVIMRTISAIKSIKSYGIGIISICVVQKCPYLNV